jgi:hypothetical protein
MNASAIINDSMTLEQKLEAIDAEIAKAEKGMTLTEVGQLLIPTDPATLVMCEGCQ